ncbi:MAG: DNA-binding transcriptional regulator [Planctomycetota bacterium]
MPSPAIRIGLVLAHSLAFYRDILRGVKTFALKRPDWVLSPITPEKRAIELAGPLRCDGYIAHLFNRATAETLLALRKPVVNVSGVLPDLPCHRVTIDHAEVGRLAARHLLNRGVRRFGFVGYPNHEFSVERERGFREIVEETGASASSFHERAHRAQDPTGLWMWNQSLQKWLAELHKPVGILASHDTQGAQISEYCRQLKLRVPDDVAIVGVDNDDLLCELARPSLSSVALPSEQIGYEAAALLDRLLDRKAGPKRPLRLPPVRVVPRQSSDVLFVEDAEVKQAIRFIRNQAHRPLRVQEVLDEVRVSRRWLERRFRETLQCGISEEIRRVHIECALALLADTELSMTEIAARAGFSDSRHLSVAFRNEVGQPPSDYRRHLRNQSARLGMSRQSAKGG